MVISAARNLDLALTILGGDVGERTLESFAG